MDSNETENSDHSDRSQHSDRSHHSNHSDHSNHTDRSHHSDRSQHSDHSGRSQHSDHSGRSQHSDRSHHSEKKNDSSDSSSDSDISHSNDEGTKEKKDRHDSNTSSDYEKVSPVEPSAETVPSDSLDLDEMLLEQDSSIQSDEVTDDISNINDYSVINQSLTLNNENNSIDELFEHKDEEKPELSSNSTNFTTNSDLEKTEEQSQNILDEPIKSDIEPFKQIDDHKCETSAESPNLDDGTMQNMKEELSEDFNLTDESVNKINEENSELEYSSSNVGDVELEKSKEEQKESTDESLNLKVESNETKNEEKAELLRDSSNSCDDSFEKLEQSQETIDTEQVKLDLESVEKMIDHKSETLEETEMGNDALEKSKEEPEQKTDETISLLNESIETKYEARPELLKDSSNVESYSFEKTKDNMQNKLEKEMKFDETCSEQNYSNESESSRKISDVDEDALAKTEKLDEVSNHLLNNELVDTNQTVGKIETIHDNFMLDDVVIEKTEDLEEMSEFKEEVIGNIDQRQVDEHLIQISQVSSILINDDLKKNQQNDEQNSETNNDRREKILECETSAESPRKAPLENTNHSESFEMAKKLEQNTPASNEGEEFDKSEDINQKDEIIESIIVEEVSKLSQLSTANCQTVISKESSQIELNTSLGENHEIDENKSITDRKEFTENEGLVNERSTAINFESVTENSAQNYLIGIIEQNIFGTKFFVFSTSSGQQITFHEEPLEVLKTTDGFVEMDAMAMLSTIKTCISKVDENLKSLGMTMDSIRTIGLTNQPSTLIAWNNETGEPLHNAILQTDSRANETIENLAEKINCKPEGYFKERSGFSLNGLTFSAKLRWLLDNNAGVREAQYAGQLMVGTVDTWILWNLTDREVYATDVTNASTTALFNIHELAWDQEICELFNIDKSILPEVRLSSEKFGQIQIKNQLQGKSIRSVVSNRQGGLFSYNRYAKMGNIRLTFTREGCYVTCLTGPLKIIVKDPAINTTIACKIEDKNLSHYTLEGMIKYSIDTMKEYNQDGSLELPVSTEETLGFAISQIGDAIIEGPYINAYDTLLKSILKTVCSESVDLLSKILDHCECKGPVSVDGERAHSPILLQMLANLSELQIAKSSSSEMSGALGAAMIAGHGLGINTEQLANHSMEIYIPESSSDGNPQNAEKPLTKNEVRKSPTGPNDRSSIRYIVPFVVLGALLGFTFRYLRR